MFMLIPYPLKAFELLISAVHTLLSKGTLTSRRYSAQILEYFMPQFKHSLSYFQLKIILSFPEFLQNFSEPHFTFLISHLLLQLFVKLSSHFRGYVPYQQSVPVEMSLKLFKEIHLFFETVENTIKCLDFSLFTFSLFLCQPWPGSLDLELCLGF